MSEGRGREGSGGEKENKRKKKEWVDMIKGGDGVVKAEERNT